ncbi:MAG: hypothetical protein IKV88_00830 [Clostridia bacterium]|nr:hypothetical protein [Clostridia bacterium]
MAESKYILYGDGIHDDQPAIQEMIDSGVCEVCLPAPKDKYLITKPLEIPSNFKLKLPRFAHIKLADGANCFMLKNKTVSKKEKRLRDHISLLERNVWYYIDELSPDREDECCNFEIEGGIWDFNNKNQDPNPIQSQKFDERHFLGHIMFFYNVRNFRLSNMTFKDPSNFAVMIDTGSYFTIENIDFDYNDGNPYAINMDGIHLNGGCHYGIIRNLKGTCYDDLVALNAYEGAGGDITNIEIDGLFAEGCHSAVRLIAVTQNVENITISNVFGTYYQYCIGLTKFYDVETTGHFDGIILNNIHASKAERTELHEVHMIAMGVDTKTHYPFIWLQNETHIKNLLIDGLYRIEHHNPIETIRIDEKTVVENLVINNASIENYTKSDVPLILNNGTVKKQSLNNVSYNKN